MESTPRKMATPRSPNKTSTPVKSPKRGHISKSPRYLSTGSGFWCDWENCSDKLSKKKYHDYALYLTHINTHSEEVPLPGYEDEGLVGYQCLWTECEAEIFASEAEFNVHRNFHAFHVKMMSRGLDLCAHWAEQYPSRTYSCPIDTTHGSSRSYIPNYLPSEFRCLWAIKRPCQDCSACKSPKKVRECLSPCESPCEEMFADAESYYCHVQNHVEEIMIPVLSKDRLSQIKWAQCQWEKCDDAFNRRSSLRSHVKFHVQEKKVACPYCGIMYIANSRFHDHLLRRSTEQIEYSSESEHEIIIPDDEHNIHTLASVATSLAAANESPTRTPRSKKRRRKEPTTHKQGNNDKIDCEICGAVFYRANLFLEHKKKHYRPMICDFCNFSAPDQSSLDHHILYRHTEHRRFKCEFCDYAAKRVNDLRVHLETHKSTAQYKCGHCANFSARSQVSLNKHVKEVHQGTSDRYCCHVDDCEVITKRGNNLVRHLWNVHRLRKPEHIAKLNFVRIVIPIKSPADSPEGSKAPTCDYYWILKEEHQSELTYFPKVKL